MPAGQPNFLEANLALLQQYHPQTYQRIHDRVPAPVGQIVHAANGRPNLTFTAAAGKTLALHDPQNPETDGVLMLEQIPTQDERIAILLGFGLGYCAEAILTNRANIQRLLVYELEPGIFLQALLCRNLAPILSDPRITLCVNQQPDITGTLPTAAMQIMLAPCHTLLHPGSFARKQKDYQLLRTTIFQYENSLKGQGKALATLGPQFIENRFNNLPSMVHTGNFADLQNLFAGIPAILVAGGPSLDDHVEQLREALGKAVILCVDTALPTLLANDIRPNFVTAIDPHDFAYEKIADLTDQGEGLSFICTPWVTPRLAKTFPAAEIFWFFSATNATEKWLATLVAQNRAPLQGATTVAHLNLAAAAFLGCSPIIFVGQDLAFSGSQTHSRHTVLSSGNPVAQMEAGGQTVIWATALDGKKLPTNPSFYSMKKFFEQMIQNTPGRYINATARGLDIEGTEILNLKKSLDSFCTKPRNIQQILKNHIHGHDNNCRDRLLEGIEKKHQHLANLLEQTVTIHAAIKSLTSEFMALKRQNPQDTAVSSLPEILQQQYADLETAFRQMDTETETWLLLEELILGGFMESERLRIAAEKLGRLPNRYLDWLIACLERFEQINKVRSKALQIYSSHLEQAVSYLRQERDILAQSDPIGQINYYLAKGEYRQAATMLAPDAATAPNSAEILFAQGVIAAHRSQLATATACFQGAEASNPAIRERAARVFAELADLYLQFALANLGNNPVSEKMLRKGLRYCPTHPQLLRELEIVETQNQFKNDVALLQSLVSAKNFAKAGELADVWLDRFGGRPDPRPSLPVEQVADFQYLLGQILLQKEDFSASLQALQIAEPFKVGLPEFRVAMLQAAFGTGDYSLGIAHLREAVKLDLQTATHWLEIGDLLAEKKIFADAIAAYEQCFLALPDNFAALEKMAECYQELQRPEAARQVLDVLQEKRDALKS